MSEVMFPIDELTVPLNALSFIYLQSRTWSSNAVHLAWDTHRYCKVESWPIELGIVPPRLFDAISLKPPRHRFEDDQQGVYRCTHRIWSPARSPMESGTVPPESLPTRLLHTLVWLLAERGGGSAGYNSVTWPVVSSQLTPGHVQTEVPLPHGSGSCWPVVL